MNADVSEIRKQESNYTATIEVFLSICVWQDCVRRQYRQAQFPGVFRYLFQEATSKLTTLKELDKVSFEKGAHALQSAE